MAQYLVTRILLTIPVFFVMSIIVFSGVRFIPGNVCLVVTQAPEATEEQCAVVYERLGLDKPAVEQYASWMGGILRGDFGESMVSSRSVFSEIQSRLGLTLELTLFAALLAVSVAIPVGVYSAVRQDRPADYLLRFMTIGWLSMPGFWVATLLITFPAKWWGYAAPVGYVQFWDDPLKNLHQLLLPAVSLGLALSASLARLTRSSMLEVLRQDYVRTAKAKGLKSRTVLYRHALKNAVLPVVTFFGLQLGYLFGGTVVLESIFGLPGIGSLLLTSVGFKDYTQIQGIVIFSTFLILAITLVVDFSYALLDPRIRFN